MSDTIDSFCDCVADECFTELFNFAVGFRGPDCQFVRIVRELLASRPTQPLTAKVYTSLGILDRWFKTASSDILQGDTTMAHRWWGLSSLVRSQLMPSSDETLTVVSQAKRHFDQCWTEASCFFKRDWQSVSAADDSQAKTAEKELYARFERGLEPWTPGSWMAWDVLCQLNNTAGPIVSETTNVLFGGDGAVMKLVVELLPGPAKLVTPNWWKLGLTAFPTRDVESYFLGAVQRVMTLAARADQAVRVRWHLETSTPSNWQRDLAGRSCEAAAAGVVLAAFERLQESNDLEGETRPTEPILDEQVAVTAAIDRVDGSDFLDWPLQPVDDLAAKFKIAKTLGIDRIGVADKQSLDGIAIPDGIHVEPVPTVGEALHLLRAVNRAFERYAEHVCSQFHYYEET